MRLGFGNLQRIFIIGGLFCFCERVGNFTVNLPHYLFKLIDLSLLLIYQLLELLFQAFFGRNQLIFIERQLCDALTLQLLLNHLIHFAALIFVHFIL